MGTCAVIPDFMAAIDNAVANLAEDGIIGVADFFTSAKYDLPNRQHSYVQRWFWRSVFDVDGIGAFAHQQSTFASVSFCLSFERLNCDEYYLVFNLDYHNNVARVADLGPERRLYLEHKMEPGISSRLSEMKRASILSSRVNTLETCL